MEPQTAHTFYFRYIDSGSRWKVLEFETPPDFQTLKAEILKVLHVGETTDSPAELIYKLPKGNERREVDLDERNYSKYVRARNEHEIDVALADGGFGLKRDLFIKKLGGINLEFSIMPKLKAEAKKWKLKDIEEWTPDEAWRQYRTLQSRLGSTTRYNISQTARIRIDGPIRDDGQDNVACVYTAFMDLKPVCLKIVPDSQGPLEEKAMVTLLAQNGYQACPFLAPLLDTIDIDNGSPPNRKGLLMPLYKAGVLDLLSACLNDLDNHEEECASVSLSLLSGLEFMHQKGLIYVDAKPQNLMACDDYAVLIDFGSCHKIGAQIKAGYTDYYGGQYPQKRAVPAFDIFSAAATVFHFTFGRVPEQGEMNNNILEVPVSKNMTHVGRFLIREMMNELKNDNPSCASAIKACLPHIEQRNLRLSPVIIKWLSTIGLKTTCKPLPPSRIPPMRG